MSRFVLHHAPHFDAEGHPASESVCYSFSNTEQHERLTMASRCYELMADKLPTIGDTPFMISFADHELSAHFSSTKWPSIITSIDGQSLTLSKLSMSELEALQQRLRDL